jgi:hypothetical protein
VLWSEVLWDALPLRDEQKDEQVLYPAGRKTLAPSNLCVRGRSVKLSAAGREPSGRIVRADRPAIAPACTLRSSPVDQAFTAVSE